MSSLIQLEVLQRKIIQLGGLPVSIFDARCMEHKMFILEQLVDLWDGAVWFGHDTIDSLFVRLMKKYKIKVLTECGYTK